MSLIKQQTHTHLHHLYDTDRLRKRITDRQRGNGSEKSGKTPSKPGWKIQLRFLSGRRSLSKLIQVYLDSQTAGLPFNKASDGQPC